jgi:hypothetical protein
MIKLPVAFSIVFLFLFHFNLHSQESANTAGIKRIIIIRHGEKPDKGDNLSCKGLNRALQLPDILYKKFGVPEKIYTPTPNFGGSTGVVRMYQTIMPFAIKYNLKINTKYDVKDYEKLVDALKKQNGTVLLVWEHKAISKIIKALGIAGKENWDDNDFDSIWIVNYHNGTPVLTKDRENINPTNECR